MNSLSALFYTVLACSLSGTIAGAAVLLFRRLTERFISPNWKCALWAIPIALLLIPFRIPLNMGAANAVQLSNTAAIRNIRELPGSFDANAERQATQAQTGTVAKTAAKGSPDANMRRDGGVASVSKAGASTVEYALPPADTADFVLNDIAPALWLLGCTATLAFFLFGMVRLTGGIKRTSAGTTDEKLTRLIQQCCSRMNLRKPVPVVVQSHIRTSAVVGAFRPRIVLPAYAGELDGETLQYIFLHELAHVKRRDMLLNDLLLFVQVLHWFNPFVWYCFKNMRQDMELATDALVLSHLQASEHKQYALSLLKAAGAGQGITMAPRLLCMADSARNIKRRIRMIGLHGWFKKRPVWISFSCILVMALAGTIFFTVNPVAVGNHPAKSPASSAASQFSPPAGTLPASVSSPGGSQIRLTGQPSASVADSGTPVSDGYSALYFLTGSVGWAAQSGADSGGGSSRLLVTKNAGASWAKVYAGPLDFLNLDFIDPQAGWAVVQKGSGQYAIEKTADGGKTWIAKKQYAVSVNHIGNFKIRFFNSDNGYAFLYDRLSVTSDGGDTWSTVSPASGASLTDCSFASAADGWVCGTADGNIVAFRTTDGGGHWTQKLKLSHAETDSSAPLQIDFVSDTAGWILLDNIDDTSKPNLYQTTDGGNMFSGICHVRGRRPYPIDMHFTSGSIGFIGTDHGAGPIPGSLLMTTDGGKTFRSLLGDVGSIDRIVFPSRQVGYLIGYNDDNMAKTGFFLRTTDGGRSWNQISTLAPAIGISFVDGNDGFGIGTGADEGAFLKTMDGGTTWQRVSTFSPQSPAQCISFISKTTGFVVAGPMNDTSQEDTLYKTTDGGRLWGKVGMVSAYCRYFKMFDEKSGIASGLGAGAAIYSKTTDGGKTWTPLPLSADGDKLTAAFSSTGNGIAALSDYKARTVTFRKIKSGIAGRIGAICPDTEIGCDGLCMIGSKAVALICTGQGSSSVEAMIVSGDGGATWKQIPLSAETGSALLDVEHNASGAFMDFPDAKDGFILVPGYDSLLCTTDGGNTWKWRACSP